MNVIRRLGRALVLVLLAAVVLPAQSQAPVRVSMDRALRPTVHARLPSDPFEFWMVEPATVAPRATALGEFATAVRFEVDGDFAKALPILTPALLRGDALGDYVTYYRGLAELRLGRAQDARRTFRGLTDAKPTGFLAEAAALREAEASEAVGDSRAALAIYDALSTTKTTAPDDVLMRVGRAAVATGDVARAQAAFAHVYYEFPFSDLAPDADAALDRLGNRAPIAPGTNRYQLELGRAEQLFATKRYAQARAAFERIEGAAKGDDHELVSLRLAECAYLQRRVREARDGVKPYIDHARRQGEALFFYAAALRDLDQADAYVAVVRRVVEEFPTETWAEEALNGLATFYIRQGDDDKADATFREMYEKFPLGRNAERAAWKIGWQSYRNRQYADTVRAFESAAAAFPRSDFRPTWLYWAARAHEALGEQELAEARFRLAATDYRNSYYGRLAVSRLRDAGPQARLVADVPSSGAAASPDAADQLAALPLPANHPTIRALLRLGLYDQAIDELHYAQKAWGESPAIQATLAWIYAQQGRAERGERQFTLYRLAINTMKRAYPQFLASDGASLPPDLLRVIFPVGYWDLIQKHAAGYGLDPYVVAALVAQESTFVPDIVSSARAVGLMQLEASTARQYARKLGLRYSPRLLTEPESSIRIGMAKLADDISRFGDLHLVLASYNAGPSAVRRWMTDRAGLPRDEFIDDIPYPETQGYVKKILGTAEDYRRLYGPEAAAAEAVAVAPAAATRTPHAPRSAAAARRPTPKHRAPRRPSASASRRKPAAVRTKPRKAV